MNHDEQIKALEGQANKFEMSRSILRIKKFPSQPLPFTKNHKWEVFYMGTIYNAAYIEDETFLNDLNNGSAKNLTLSEGDFLHADISKPKPFVAGELIVSRVYGVLDCETKGVKYMK